MEANFLHLLAKLSEAGVNSVIIGGFAGAIHGSSLFTEDIDICCDFSVDNLLRLQKALDGLHPIHRMTPGKLKLELTEENCKSLKNLYLDTDLGQLDCVSYVQGIGPFDKVRAASDRVQVAGREYCVLQVDALILSKQALGRAKDVQAIYQLEAIRDRKRAEGGQQQV